MIKIFILKIHLLFLVFPFVCFASASQAQYIHFVENKGQWDSRVNFAGQVSNNAFFLEKNGYRVSLSNGDDWKKMADFFSAHHDSASKPVATGNEDRWRVKDEKNSVGSQGNNNNDVPAFSVRCHAYEVTFLNASSSPELVPDKALDTYNNYYIGNDKTKWASGCKLYQAVVYKNMYPNIDVRYYTYNNQLKYDIIVHPGGDVSKIAMQFAGTDGLSVKKGNLIVATSLGNMTELAPVSYQSSATSKATVNVAYSIIGNTVRFKSSAYDKQSTLIIDPQIIFCSLSGSTADNWGYTATYDAQGNFYAGGIAFADGVFPTTLGAYSRNFNGGGTGSEGTSAIDVGIIKFDKNGRTLLFGTYLGGDGDEQPHSLVVDADGNLLIGGRTSSKNFPATSDKYGPEGGAGDIDIFLTKLSSTGGMVASRRIGGSQNDGVNIAPKYKEEGIRSIRRNYGDDARSEVLTDADRNVYLASVTQSADYPTSSNAFQKTIGNPVSAAPQDGVIIKASPDLSTILLSSYVGGSGNDAAFVLALSPADNNIYLAGATASNDMPGITNSSPAYRTYNGGDCDGFVSVINNTTYALIKTSYFGTNGADIIYGIQFDKFGFPYIMGTTTGAWPVNAAWSQPNGKQFISKLQKDMSAMVYSTVFGKGTPIPDISPTAFLVDRCENVYVSGWSGEANKGYQEGQSSIGLYIPPAPAPKPYQGTTDGSDFYFLVLKRDAIAPLYATFFGQRGGYPDHVDGGTSRFDREGVIYQAVCANCEFYTEFPNVYFPTTANVVASENNSRNGAGCNLAAIKIAFELAGIGNGVRASIEGRLYDTTGCVPLMVNFVDTLNEGKSFIWSFGDGSPDTTTLIANVSHTYNQIGNYRVRLVSVDSSACNISDTSYTTIKARKDKADLSFTSTKLPPCTSLSYQFTNTSTAPVGKPFSSGSFVWDFGDGSSPDTVNQPPVHAYAAEGTYLVKLYLIDTNYCNAPDMITDTLRIASNVKAQFETPPAGCVPYTAIFNNTSLAGQSFVWDFGDGDTSHAEYPMHLYSETGTYTMTLTATDSNTCNKVSTSAPFQIIVSPNPTAVFSFGPSPAVNNTPTTFFNASLDATSFNWNFGDGDEIETTEIDTTIRHIYDRTDTFQVRLVAYNQYGCTDTAYHTVASIITPLVDVPNALSPTGTNRQISVKGFGIEKMDWRIYNRWGTLLFVGTSQKIGWDGTYKGVLQPQEVYTYVLNVEFSDGKKYQKTGDITLIR